MQPVTFLRDTWKKWEQKRSEKRSTQSAFGYRSSFSRAKRRASIISDRNTLPKTKVSYEDYTTALRMSHRWMSIRRRNPSPTGKKQTSSTRHMSTPLPRRNSQPPAAVPSDSKYSSHVGKLDDRPTDFYQDLDRYPSRVPSLKPILTKKHHSQGDIQVRTVDSNPKRSSFSSPKMSRLDFGDAFIINENVVVSDQREGVLSRTLGSVSTPSSQSTMQLGPSRSVERGLTLPQVQEGYTTINYNAPRSTSPVHTGDVEDFPLSLFPLPPPLVRSEREPKLDLRTVGFSSHSNSLLPYSPLGSPTFHRPGSQKSLPQMSIPSPSKRSIQVGRPRSSVPPPPTNPPTSALPNPPVNDETDPSMVKRRLTGSESVAEQRDSSPACAATTSGLIT